MVENAQGKASSCILLFCALSLVGVDVHAHVIIVFTPMNIGPRYRTHINLASNAQREQSPMR